MLKVERGVRHQDESEPRRFSRRMWLIGALVLGLCVLCGAGLALLPRLLAPRVTPQMEQIAEQALSGQAQPAIDLGTPTVQQWYPPSGTDFALEDGMVVFPQPTHNRVRDAYSAIILNWVMPALVYAPDGRTLSSSPEPPVDRGYYFYNEWFLYGCEPVADHALWRRCTLLIGGNI